VHVIVSSALIPESVAKRLQESHHVEAPAASPTLAYGTGTVVGGPSRAPVSVPSTIASFNSSGIHYRKQEQPKSVQAYTGLPSKPGPHSLNKAMRKAELHLGTLPESKQKQFADIGVFNPSTAKAIEGACRLTGRLVAEEAEKLASSAHRLVIADNAVASGNSTTLNDPPAHPLVERLTTPPPSEVEPPLPPKKVCKRACKNKGKKDSVHPTSVAPNMGNVRIFLDQARICDLYNDYELTAPKSNFSNPLAENGETLFREPVQNHENPYNLNEVNPRHPHAPFYQRLIVFLKQEPRGHINFNGDNVGIYDPYLDDVSLGNDMEYEDSGEEIKPGPSIKRKVPNPGGVCWSEEKTQSYKEGWDDRDNNPDSYAYDNYGQGYVNFSNHFAHINDKQHVALISSLCSLLSNVEHLNIMLHSVNCAKCVKENKDQIDLLADSGASLHFTNQRSDLSEYEVVDDKDFTVTTASAGRPLTVAGRGSMYLTTSEIHRQEAGRVIHLYPVFYVNGLTHKYLSVGALLNSGLELRGSSSKLEFRTHKSNQLEFLCEPHEPDQNLYWFSATLVRADSLLASTMVSSIDYNIMHRHFAHPSMDVLQHASGNTQDFPNILIPKENPICPGCAEGKMTCSLFSVSDQQSAKPFDKVHMDLKSMLTRSYHRYNFFLILFDDCTSQCRPGYSAIHCQD
jgi:hypothetical protein